MPSLFAALASAASATVDAVYAEGFTIEGRARPATPAGRVDVNAGTVPSTVRVSYPFQGIWIAVGAVLHAHGRAMSDATTRGVVAEQPMVDVDLHSLLERPQMGDIVRRDATGERFTVTRFKAVDFGRALVMLAEIR
jgi:hypothetical protein